MIYVWKYFTNLKVSNILPNIADLTISLPRKAKISIVVFVDIFFCGLSSWLAVYLRLGEFIFSLQNLHLSIILSVGISIPLFFSFGLYKEIFRFSRLNALFAVFRAIALYAIIFCPIILVIGIDGIPRTIGLIQPILLLFLVAISKDCLWAFG